MLTVAPSSTRTGPLQPIPADPPRSDSGQACQPALQQSHAMSSNRRSTGRSSGTAASGTQGREHPRRSNPSSTPGSSMRASARTVASGGSTGSLHSDYHATNGYHPVDEHGRYPSVDGQCGYSSTSPAADLTAVGYHVSSSVAPADQTVRGGPTYPYDSGQPYHPDPHREVELGGYDADYGYAHMPGGVHPRGIRCDAEGNLDPESVQALQPTSSSQHGMPQYLTVDDSNSSVLWHTRSAMADMGAAYGDYSLAEREEMARQIAEQAEMARGIAEQEEMARRIGEQSGHWQ
ncbi:MAG: alpha,alpha-trehalase nth1 [Watsoniomyces obsoletus]|nr:MAG: alpha,alpha-trehalase nth1 [Watsoniomyces obsoletus]